VLSGIIKTILALVTSFITGMGTRPYFIHSYMIMKHCAIRYLLSHYPVLSPQSPPFRVEMPGIRTYILALRAEQWTSAFWEVDISAQIWAFFSLTTTVRLNYFR